MLACGNRLTAVLTKTGHVRVCGDNGEGQLGFGKRPEVKLLSRIPWNCGSGSYIDVDAQMVAASDSFFAVVDKTGNVWVSGSHQVIPNLTKTMQIIASPRRITFVAAGFMHCMAIADNQQVFAVGKNFCGQLGTGDLKRTSQFVPVADGPWMGTTTMLATGGCFSVLLSGDGDVWTCGMYASCCLALTQEGMMLDDELSTNDRNIPTKICNNSLPDGRISFVAAGTSHVVVIAGGSLYSWGHNSSAQLGTGDFETHMSPVRVGGVELFGSPVRLASANKYHTLVLTEKRELWVFGNAETGRLGLGREERLTLSARFVKTPVRVNNDVFDNRRISSISAGFGHSAVLTEEGFMYTWGQGKKNEWRNVVPSALGHLNPNWIQNAPLLVHDRCVLCSGVSQCKRTH